MTTTGIRIAAVSKTYSRGRVRALQDVSCSFERGTATGLVGPNGAGKSTLLACVLGLSQPDAGFVSMGGFPPDDRSVRRRTGAMSDPFVGEPILTAREYLGVQDGLAGNSRTGRAGRVTASLDRVALEPGARDRKLRDCSKGMRQRVGLASVLLLQPDFVVLDEPASGVDPAGRALVRALVEEWRGNGACVVLSSHQLEDIERCCDAAVFLERGSIRDLADESRSQSTEHRVRLASRHDGDGEKIAIVARCVGARWLGERGADLRFEVASGASPAALVAGLVSAGLPVISVAPESTSLERAFLEGSPEP